jgi:preprotein translocase subunit Sss1
MEKVEEKLDNINKTLEGILEVMKKPENKFQNALTLAGAGVGVLGIIHIIDTILNWIGG